MVGRFAFVTIEPIQEQRRACGFADGHVIDDFCDLAGCFVCCGLVESATATEFH
jgi:hypothetical protein